MNAEPPKDGDSLEFVPFRDGIPFSSNLVALHQLMDKEFDDDVTKDPLPVQDNSSISILWQRALRALSRPSLNASPTFQSKAWRLRQMITQLGSFTQLRHDSLLYTKKGSSFQLCCEYADGMVDPYPAFWQRMGELAQQMSDMLEKVLTPLMYFMVWSPKFSCDINLFNTPDGERFLGKSRKFFKSFAKTMKFIEEIASLQAHHQPLCETQVDFLKTVMEERFGSGGSKYVGWYPRLFFESREDSGKSDVIVVDVHTDSPSSVDTDSGGVLHLGVGNPLMAFFVVDKTIFAGPVFSSYEFLTPSDQRLTDEEFEHKLPAMEMPQWQHQSYLS
ncbi:hypothetical protein P3T76_004294 [Phytophthora citrophthora]|uniref:Uncharacterized protein n=1 Tax=Phytophthora citrophthora TaxID=4793 RepID=A0AAD9GTI2_9STRA|nr:hypothetical protein P3T76_004294 [Phytophthora citrophthora]